MIRKFINDLRRRGIEFRVEGESLICDAPLESLTGEERDRIRELKPQIVKHLAARVAPASRIQPVPRDRPMPLGLVQQRMWLLDRLEPGSTVNNLPGAWRLNGALDPGAMTSALHEVVRRHEILRTRVVDRGGEPVQVVEPDHRPELPMIDLRTLPEEDRADEMMRQIRFERDTPFDLSRLPLLRARLFRLDDREHVLFMVTHHVIWDGWSWDVFHAEMSALYDAFRNGRPSPLPDLPVQYADYAVWHRDLMSGPEFERQLEYWRRVLDGELPLLHLPIDGMRPERVSQEGGRRILDIDGPLAGRLWEIGRAEDATLFMVLLTAYAAWLLRYSGQDDVTIGVPTQDRLKEGADRLIGVLVNTLVVRVRLKGQPTFRELLRQVRDTCIDAYDNQDIPFDRLVDELGVQRSSSYTALYQTLFTFQDVRNRPERLGDLTLSQVHVDTGVAPTDVLFGFMVGHDRTVALLDFAADLFRPESMSRMAASFAGLLRDAAAHPDRPVSRLSIVAGSSEHRRESTASDLFAVAANADATSIEPTFGQEGMWFLERTAPGTPVHHLIDAYRLRGDVRPELLSRALGIVSMRQETLRYRFPEDHGEVRIEVIPGPLDVVEYRDLSLDAGAEAAAEVAFVADARRPFDLESGPLLRALLLKLGADDFALQIVFHHMIVDERSLAVVYDDLAVVYGELLRGAEGALPAVRRTFREFAARTRSFIATSDAARQLDFWSARLSEPPPPMDFSDLTRPPMPSMSAASVPIAFDDAASTALDQLSAPAERSAQSVLLSALHIVLNRYGVGARLAVGMPVQVRPAGDDWDDVAGLFLNTVVIESELDSDATFSSQVGSAERTYAEGVAHSAIPFSKVVEQLRPSRARGNAPLFQVLLSVETQPPARLFLDGAAATPSFRERHGVETDIAFYLSRDSAGWDGRIDFSTDLFERATVERLARHLVTVLNRAAESPDERTANINLLSADELRSLQQMGAAELAIAEESVLTAIAERAAVAADAVALVQRSERVTYAELWQRSGAAARALRERGIGRESIVGICFERCPDMVVAQLAVWRAGAAYLPLDPSFPEERLGFMLTDSGATLVLTDGVADSVLPIDETTIVELRDIERDGMDSHADLPVPAAHDLAYIIYTSGSTGRPKGVEIEHDALHNFIASMAREPGLDPDDVVLAVTTLSFDISLLELFLPLTIGASVVIADEDEVLDGELLAHCLERSGVTAMQATPATWRMLLDAGWNGPLRKLLCGGEAFPPELLVSLRERAGEVWNMYGPTETTIWSTVARVNADYDQRVPIGRPVANTRTYVVDEHGRFVPQGTVGELWIGGRGVARGYHARPELTAERFMPDPFAASAAEDARVYRTGDLARWRGDGQLEHLGRIDNQVKVRGFRIELGEIESVLSQHEDVAQAVVAVKQGSDGESRLVAYLVWQGRESMLVSELRRFLAQRLPDYMVPGVMITVTELPLTPNGKIDRNALPNPLVAATVREFAEPETPAQQAVAAVWRELLQQDRVGQHDNFFELGGHSLLSIRAVALVEERIGVRLDPRSMFFQTLAQVAADVEDARTATASLA